MTNSSTVSVACNHEDQILKLLRTKALLGYSCCEFYLRSLWGRVGGICPHLTLSPIVLRKKIPILRWKLIKSSHCSAWPPICQKHLKFCMPDWQIRSISGTWNTMKNYKTLIWYILCSIYYGHEWFSKFRLASGLMYGFKIKAWVASEDVQCKSVSLVTEQWTNGNHHVIILLGFWYIQNDWIDLLFIFNILKYFYS